MGARVAATTSGVKKPVALATVVLGSGPPGSTRERALAYRHDSGYSRAQEEPMAFSDKMRDLIDKGMAASKDLARKAGEKAKELGAKGALKLEIMQQQSHAEKLIAKLGNEVYSTLVEKDQATVSRNTPAIRDVLQEIEKVRDTIEAKQKEFAALGGKED
jgi:hypothetical protein